jgi:hypothetical protein
MINRQRTIAGLLLAFLLVLGCQMSFAQGIITGSIAGTVVDSTGAIIPGATVSAKQIETNLTFNTVTGDSGYFQVSKIPPGQYVITVEATNFRTLKINGTGVSVAQEVQLGKIQMQIGGKSEIVEVSGAAPLVETQASQISMTFDTKKVADLPIGRGFDQLALFLPGVQTTGNVSRANSNGAQFSVNGQRLRSNNFQIDGQGINDQSVTGPAIFLVNPDIIAEYQVMTNYDSSYGRNLGSQVNIITKSGTNGFHGTGAYTWRGSTFDSLANQEKNPLLGACLPSQFSDPTGNKCKLPKISRYVRNTPSFTVGGPIIKNRAWFFGSGIWDRIRTAGSPTTSGSQVTPTSAGVAALAAAFPNSPGVAFLKSPFGPLQTAGNPTVTPNGTKTVTVNGVTVPVEVGLISRNIPSVSNTRQFTGRGDVQLTSKDRVFARYLIDDEISTNASNASTDANGAAGFWVDVPSRGQQIGADWTRQWSNNFLNQVRFNWTTLKVLFEGGTSPCLNATPDTCPISVAFADSTLVGMGVATNIPQGRQNKNYELQDNGSWAHGIHTFKFGGDWQKQSPTSFFLPSYNGGYTFPDLSSFIANTPSRLSGVNGPFTIVYHENDLAFYLQDDIRLRSDFTIQAGVRWEYYQNTINQLHDLSVAQQTGSAAYWDKNLSLDLTTIHQIPEDYNNFGPVVGFAWNARDKMVVRGGFRVAYDPSFYNIQLNVSSVAPMVNSTTLATSAGDVVPAMPTSGFTGAAARPTFQASLPVGLNPGLRSQSLVADNYHNPYSEQWNLGVQYEITPKMVVESRYLGNHGVGLFQNLNGNIAITPFTANGFGNFVPSGVTACATAGAPGAQAGVGFADCNHRGVTLRANTAGNSYNALQSRFDIRDYHGLTSTLSWTWAHNIDNASEIFSTLGAGLINVPQNPFDNGNGERGSSNFDYRHTVGLQVVYEVPWYKSQQGFVGRALGGWQANVTYRYATGQPYTPIQNRSALYGNSAVDLCDPSSLFSSSTDACRPILGNPSAPFNSVGVITAVTNGVPTVMDMKDSKLLTPTLLQNVHWVVNNLNAAKYYGSPFLGVQRNSLTGQATNAVNLAMQKNFKVTERVNFQFRATAFNVLNHMFLGVPNNNIMNAVSTTNSFGSLGFNSSGGGNTNTIENGLSRRRLEFGGKVSF